MKRWIAGIVLICSILLLSISGYFLTDMLMQERKDDGLQEQLKEIYEDSERGIDGGSMPQIRFPSILSGIPSSIPPIPG